MANAFQKLPLKKFPKAELIKDTREQKLWRSFEFPVIVKEYSAINHVHFSPVQPYNCLVTSSAKVQMFAPITNEVKRTSTRTKENVYGARFRNDGKLMVTGGDSGTVQVLDINSRSILRSFKGHAKATHVCSFGRDESKVYSASDDKTVRKWDIPTESEISCIKAHKDYIRCGCVHPTNTEVFLTASYDHTVKIWDQRSSECAHEMDHGAPVESIVVHNNGTLCLTSGSNYVKVWDLLSGGKLFRTFSNHQKTITSLCFNGDCSRLLSAGLDRHVKVYDVEDYSLVANIDYPSPVLAMDVSADCNHLVVGMADGAISLRHKSATVRIEEAETSRKRALNPGSYQHRMRNQNAKPNTNDIVIEDRKTKKLSKMDRCLQRFRYGYALDAVLNMGKVDYIISLIEELARRNALEVALANRDADSLQDLMHFLVKNISHPMYAKTLVPVANLLIEMYSYMVGSNKKFDYMLKKLSARIKTDLDTGHEMMKLLGALDQIFTVRMPTPDANLALNFDDKTDSIILTPNNSEIDFVVTPKTNKTNKTPVEEEAKNTDVVMVEG